MPNLLWFALLASLSATPAPNPLFQTLVSEGVTLDGGDVLKLPPPAMNDGLDAAAQKAAVAAIPNAKPFATMAEHSVNAPFIYSLKNAAVTKTDGRGRQVDLYFIAYGDWDKLTDEKYLEQRFKGQPAPEKKDDLPSDSHSLSAEELSARSITLSTDEGVRESLAWAEFPILEKVVTAGASRVMQTYGQDSITVALMFDPRFAADAEFPNRWRPATRLANGTHKLGEPQPYSGVGGYVKITRMAEPAGAAFFEVHLVFFEPKGWFNNSSQLSSKLGAVVQDQVRDFRRELEKPD